MYIHLKRGLADNGKIVATEDVDSIIGQDNHTDWYSSSYEYSDDIVKYYENNIQTSKKGEEYHSIAGFPGLASTNKLYWDIDSSDFEKARTDALKIIDELEVLSGDKNLGAITIAFSGNKGFHIVLHTTSSFNPEETRNICESVANKVDAKIDTVVYNKTRAFRILNTKHQVSGLYKVELSYNELKDWTESRIKEFAVEPREVIPHTPIGGAFFKERFGKREENLKNVLAFKKEKSLNPPPPCPHDKRSCIHNLEYGFFLAGERENALVRLAAYNKGKGLSRDATHGLLIEALEKRAERYPDTEKWHDRDNERVLDLIFSDRWKGGMFSCKTDNFLKEHCDGEGACAVVVEGEEKVRSSVITALDLGRMIEHEYAQHTKPYPKFGIEELDKVVRLQPKAFTLVNGANGSGKTSLIIKAMEALNEQQRYHLVYSLDMSDNALFFKLATRYTNYSYRTIEDAFHGSTKEKAIVDEIVNTIAIKFPYTLFEFGSSHTMHDLKDIVIKTKKERGIDIDVVFVDYIGKILGRFENNYASATDNSHALLDAIKQTKAHWVVLSQVSRANGDHTEALLTSRVAKDSGSWEENATYVVNVWRPFGNGLSGEDKYFCMYIAKARSDGCKEMVFGWNGKRGDIYTMSPEEYIEYAMLCIKTGKREPPANPNDANYALKIQDVKDEVQEEQKDEEIPKHGNRRRQAY